MRVIRYVIAISMNAKQLKGKVKGPLESLAKVPFTLLICIDVSPILRNFALLLVVFHCCVFFHVGSRVTNDTNVFLGDDYTPGSCVAVECTVQQDVFLMHLHSRYSTERSCYKLVLCFHRMPVSYCNLLSPDMKMAESQLLEVFICLRPTSSLDPQDFSV